MFLRSVESPFPTSGRTFLYQTTLRIIATDAFIDAAVKFPREADSAPRVWTLNSGNRLSALVP
jgi:hypothetical protein